MKKLGIFAVLVASVGAAALFAPMAEARGKGGERASFEMLDADGDGQVTQADLDTLRNERFAEFDADGDGSVTEEEFMARASAQAGERAAAMFARLDADGDGVLSRDVIEQGRGGDRAGRMIERLDTDGDGAVSAEEFEAAQERRAGLRERFGRHGGDRNR
ncbi:MAG: EF-hand domain-containing protein [Pseudomonadota bacterium]